MKTIYQIAEDALLHTCKAGGYTASETKAALSMLRALSKPSSNQPAPSNFIAACEAMKREDIENMKFRDDLKRRTEQN